MNAQSVSANRVDEFGHLRGRVLPRLDTADVGKEENVRRDIPNRIGRRQPRIFEHRPLGPEPHRETQLVRGRRQRAIDLERTIGTTGHPRDQDGRAQPTPQERDRRIDFVEAELRKGLVNEFDFVEQRRTKRFDFLVRTEVEMRKLSLHDLAHAANLGRNQILAAMPTRSARERRTTRSRHGKFDRSTRHSNAW